MRTTKKTKSEDVKEHISRTAARLFAKTSYDAVGIREIAREAGVNSAMISYYFNGKSGIIKEIYQGFTELYRDLFYRALSVAQDIQGFYTTVIRNTVESYHRQPDIYIVCLTEYSNDIPEVRDIKAGLESEAEMLLANISAKFKIDLSAMSMVKNMMGPLSLVNSILAMLILGVSADKPRDDEFYKDYTTMITGLMMYGITGALKKTGN